MPAVEPPARRSLLRAILHTLATVAIGQGAQIVAGIATARAFGPAGKGIISYASLFVNFAIAGVEGLRNAFAFQVANEVPLRAAWRTAIAILAGFAPLGSLLFLGLWLHDPTQPAFLFVAIVFPFAAFLQTANILYLVRHAIERINVQNAYTVGAGSAVVTLVAVWVFHASVVAVLCIWVGGYVIASLWAAVGLTRLLRGERTDSLPPISALAREQSLFALKGGASAVITLLALRIDVLIVGSTLPKTSLGVYVTAVALGELMWTLSRSVTWAATGRISTEPRAAAIELTAKVIRLLLGVQLVAGAVVFALGPYAITLFYGEKFAGAGMLLQILLPRMIVYSADGVLSYFISVREGRPGIQLTFESATLALCAALTWAAVGRYGLAGAALAATASFTLAFFAKLAYFVRVTGVGWGDVLALRYDDVPDSARARLRAFFARV